MNQIELDENYTFPQDLDNDKLLLPFNFKTKLKVQFTNTINLQILFYPRNSQNIKLPNESYFKPFLIVNLLPYQNDFYAIISTQIAIIISASIPTIQHIISLSPKVYLIGNDLQNIKFEHVNLDIIEFGYIERMPDFYEFRSQFIQSYYQLYKNMEKVLDPNSDNSKFNIICNCIKAVLFLEFLNYKLQKNSELQYNSQFQIQQNLHQSFLQEQFPPRYTNQIQNYTNVNIFQQQASFQPSQNQVFVPNSMPYQSCPQQPVSIGPYEQFYNLPFGMRLPQMNPNSNNSPFQINHFTNTAQPQNHYYSPCYCLNAEGMHENNCFDFKTPISTELKGQHTELQNSFENYYEPQQPNYGFDFNINNQNSMAFHSPHLNLSNDGFIFNINNQQNSSAFHNQYQSQSDFGFDFNINNQPNSTENQNSHRQQSSNGFDFNINNQPNATENQNAPRKQSDNGFNFNINNQQNRSSDRFDKNFNTTNSTENSHRPSPTTTASNEFGFDFSINRNLRNYSSSLFRSNDQNGFDFSFNSSELDESNEDTPIRLTISDPNRAFNLSQNSNSSTGTDFSFSSSMTSSSNSTASMTNSASSSGRNNNGFDFSISNLSLNDEDEEKPQKEHVYIPPCKRNKGKANFAPQQIFPTTEAEVRIITNDEDNLDFPPGFSGQIFL